jgi:tetratricopeptide (TPR) repeat protein
MYEAVLETLPESPLIVPVDEEAIGKLFSLDPPLDMHPKPGVLWLDDLDEARLGALTPAFLDRLGSKVVIVASMTSQRRDRITRSDSDIGRVARQALDSAEKIHLNFELTDEERTEAEALYPGERFDHGIGEPLVAADQLVARFDAGRDARDDDNKPVGHALVRAAIDWRRAGLTRPIRHSELRALYPEYLSSVRAGLEPSEDLYDGGLAWACEPVASHVALLEKMNLGEEHGFVAFDYLVALSDGQHAYPRRDVLPAMWDFVVGSLSEEEVEPAGFTAYLRNDLAVAERIWRKVAGGSSDYSAQAAFNLGALLEERGDAEGAEAAYQHAIDSGYPDEAPIAEVNLGVLLQKRGDAEGAQAAYQHAIDSGHSDVAPRAALNLGLLLEERGETEGARTAYQRAIDSGHPDEAPRAEVMLSDLDR